MRIRKAPSSGVQQTVTIGARSGLGEIYQNSREFRAMRAPLHARATE